MTNPLLEQLLHDLENGDGPPLLRQQSLDDTIYTSLVEAMNKVHANTRMSANIKNMIIADTMQIFQEKMMLLHTNARET